MLCLWDCAELWLESSSALAQVDDADFLPLGEEDLPRTPLVSFRDPGASEFEDTPPVSLGRHGKGYSVLGVRKLQPSLKRPSVSASPAPKRPALDSLLEEELAFDIPDPEGVVDDDTPLPLDQSSHGFDLRYLDKLHQYALARNPDYQQAPSEDHVLTEVEEESDSRSKTPLPLLNCSGAWRRSRYVFARVLGERAKHRKVPFKTFQSAFMARNSCRFYSAGPSPSFKAPGALKEGEGPVE